MQEKFITISEAAKILGISHDTLGRWGKKGLLKPHHISPSGYRYYTEKQIYEFLEGYYGDYEKARSTIEGVAAMPEKNDVDTVIFGGNSDTETIDMVFLPDKSDSSEEQGRQGKAIVGRSTITSVRQN